MCEVWPLTPCVEVAAVARTAVRSCDGELAGWHPVALAGVVGGAALDRAGMSNAELDEVVVGCADPVGANGANAARAVVLAADWPKRISGQVIDRGETSGLGALHMGAALISAGHAESVLVIGLGLCSVVPPGASAVGRPYGVPWSGAITICDGAAAASRFSLRDGLLPAPRLAEQAAQQAGIDRGDIEAAAEKSRRQRLAMVGANAAIVAVEARRGRRGRGRAGAGSVAESFAASSSAGHTVPASADHADVVIADAIHEWSDVEELPPIFNDEGLLTAVTFASPADAVAAVLLRRSLSSPIGLPGVGVASHCAEIVGIGRSGGDPADPTGGIARAVRQALNQACVDLVDMRQVVSVEPDAATLLLLARAIGIEPDSMNPAGGALATGNAGAAEELRLVADGLACSHIGPMAVGGCYDDADDRDRLGLRTSMNSGRLETSTGSDEHLLAMSAGPTGSAAVVLRLREVTGDN